MNALRIVVFTCIASLLIIGFQPNLALPQSNDNKKEDVSLLSFTPVKNDGIEGVKTPFTVSSIICDYGLRVRDFGPDTVSIIFDLKRQYRSFRAKIGVLSDSGEGAYSIILDGKVLSSGKMSGKDLPIDLALDISDGRSLKITMGNYLGFGNPLVSKKSLTDKTSANAKSKRDNCPVLVEPQEGEKLTVSPVVFKWKPLPKATAYAIQIVLKKRSGKQSDPDVRMWSFTIGDSKTSYSWDFKDAPSGEYLWTVLAFDEARVVGIFSDDRSFTIVR